MKLDDLYEASITPLKVKEQTVEEAIAFLNKHCLTSLWMLKAGKPIYKGFRTKLSTAPFMLIDTENSERRSENTANWYTLGIDNSPAFKGWPKRSKSLICTTSLHRAEDFAGSIASIYAVIPTDSAKIGCTRSEDMWDTVFSKRLANSLSWVVREAMDTLKLKAIPLNDWDVGPTTFEEWKKRLGYISTALKGVTKKLMQDDLVSFLSMANLPSSDLPYIIKNGLDKYLMDKIFTPERGGFKLYTPAEFKDNRLTNVEVWVGGKVVLIPVKVWRSMRNAIKGTS